LERRIMEEYCTAVPQDTRCSTMLHWLVFLSTSHLVFLTGELLFLLPEDCLDNPNWFDIKQL
jgi:hypothetical protein